MSLLVTLTVPPPDEDAALAADAAAACADTIAAVAELPALIAFAADDWLFARRCRR